MVAAFLERFVLGRFFGCALSAATQNLTNTLRRQLLTVKLVGLKRYASVLVILFFRIILGYFR